MCRAFVVLGVTSFLTIMGGVAFLAVIGLGMLYAPYHTLNILSHGVYPAKWVGFSLCVIWTMSCGLTFIPAIKKQFGWGEAIYLLTIPFFAASVLRLILTPIIGFW